MARNKKPSASSSSQKKKKNIQVHNDISKKTKKLDNKKVKIISERINKINKNFENLITDCQIALKKLS